MAIVEKEAFAYNSPCAPRITGISVSESFFPSEASSIVCTPAECWLREVFVAVSKDCAGESQARGVRDVATVDEEAVLHDSLGAPRVLGISAFASSFCVFGGR